MLFGAAFFASFLGRSRKGVPCGGLPHLNQRAEGTNKNDLFDCLVRWSEIRRTYNLTTSQAGFTRPANDAIPIKHRTIE